jgi:molybdate transport system regulatory protein
MAKQPEVRMWIKLELAGRGEIGPGKIALLRHIREQGSISAAARAMEMSYRRAWQLVDELNRVFGSALVETHVGGSSRGGAQLTPLGQDVIERYDAVARCASRACQDLLRGFLDHPT